MPTHQILATALAAILTKLAALIWLATTRRDDGRPRDELPAATSRTIPLDDADAVRLEALARQLLAVAAIIRRRHTLRADG
jgi:hypothetical protein